MNERKTGNKSERSLENLDRELHEEKKKTMSERTFLTRASVDVLVTKYACITL